MIIIDQETGNQLNNILVMLTTDEFGQLTGFLRGLDPAKGDHIHVDNKNYQKEMTIAVYTPENLLYFRKDLQDILKMEG